MKQIYSEGATVSGGRMGRGRTSDGRLELTFSAPQELGGPSGEETNPEQLFAFAYAACFESALRLAAQNRGKQVNGSSVTANVTLSGDRNTGFRLGVTLRATVPGLERNQVEELLRAAHETCRIRRPSAATSTSSSSSAKPREATNMLLHDARAVGAERYRLQNPPDPAPPAELPREVPPKPRPIPPQPVPPIPTPPPPPTPAEPLPPISPPVPIDVR